MRLLQYQAEMDKLLLYHYTFSQNCFYLLGMKLTLDLNTFLEDSFSLFHYSIFCLHNVVLQI